MIITCKEDNIHEIILLNMCSFRIKMADAKTKESPWLLQRLAQPAMVMDIRGGHDSRDRLSQ